MLVFYEKSMNEVQTLRQELIKKDLNYAEL